MCCSAAAETEDYWAFLKATQDDRQIEPDSVVGIILSANVKIVIKINESTRAASHLRVIPSEKTKLKK